MADWVIVVDDDVANLKVAGTILSRNKIRVTALNSGRSMLDYIREHGAPDLILLDILMPEMDGFETLKQYRALEKELAIREVPVVFLTADEDSRSESRGFEMGVSDYIRKPINPDILLRRVENILSTQDRMLRFAEEAATDKMTGFLNKSSANERISRLCAETKGCLCLLDMDSFKLVNDLYGHETGDRVLCEFSRIIKENLPFPTTFGRIGGDEFLFFCEGLTQEADLKHFSDILNEKMLEQAHRIMGDKMEIPLGASIGAVMVPEGGTEFSELFRIADKMLYAAKQGGRHRHLLYSPERDSDDRDIPADLDLETLSRILEERNIPQNAMWMGREAFSDVYRYMMRYMDRYQGSAYKLLYTVGMQEDLLPTDRSEIMEAARKLLQESLRSSDILMQIGENHFFLLLPEINQYHVQRVIERIDRAWGQDPVCAGASLSVEADSIRSEKKESLNGVAPRTDWVVVVDDDMANLTVVGNILSREKMRVSALQSGQAFLDFMKSNSPDIILLDIKMPEMDGFETLKRLRSQGGRAFRTPVIFLTADEDEASETRGLSLGAMDFIRKPIIPSSLILRVRHTLELVRLQSHLTQEVNKKTEENELLSRHIIRAMAEAVEAKDTYTHGHSGRVAQYSQEIARRHGYSEKKANEIYILGLLHDVGKIGVPDAVINKRGRLDDEEYEQIKQHPAIGARILKSIKEMPQLANGARWHHERYDGKGYPDGLRGEAIPEEARIIAVADAYDAMTSNRSYRAPLPQEVVMAEIRNGSGTQFDPHFAAIMLRMIEEDTEFVMKEP